MNKGLKIDPGRESKGRVKDQGERFAVHLAEGAKGKAYYHKDADINQQKLQFSAPMDMPLLEPNPQAQRQPDAADGQNHSPVGNLNHVHCASTKR